MNQLFQILLILAIFGQNIQAKGKRSRGEGIPAVSASNTVGTGNIWFESAGKSYMQTGKLNLAELQNVPDKKYYPSLTSRLDTNYSLTKKDLLLAPQINGTIGLTGFMHIEGTSIPWDGDKIGITTGSIKLTLPNNDNLRIFGAGLMLNVTLSTEENSYTVLEETPAFDPLISYTLIGDIDLIKYNPTMPFKLYFNYSNADNFRFYYLYSQHNFKLAFEYKGENKSIYSRFGMALYKEKENSKNPNPNPDFIPPLFEMGIGFKKYFDKAFPFSLYADIQFDPLNPIKFLSSELRKPIQIEMGIKIPIFYKETNAEALRSLIFTEQNRLENKNTTAINKFGKRKAKDLTLDRLLLENYDRDMLDDPKLNEIFKHKSEKEILEQRKKIKKTLKSESDNK